MVKQIIRSLFITIVFISPISVVNAQELSLGYSIDYIFKPNEPQDIVNNYFFTISAKCEIKATDDSDDIQAKIVSGSGSLNSNELNTGEEITLTVHNNDKLFIVAPSGAKVRLTNLGLHEVKAMCFPA